MKKHITLLLLALAVTFGAKAQDATLFKTESDYYVEGWDCVNTSDGCVIFQTLYFDDETPRDLGRVFYKIDMNGVAIDSVFYADTIDSHRMRFMKDPRDEASNLLLKIDNTDKGNFLHVVGISDALELSEELYMPLPGGEQGEISNWEIIIDDNDDIIVFWQTDITDIPIRHFDRIGLDGTVKTVSDTTNIDDTFWPASGTLFCKSKNPLEYGFIFHAFEIMNGMIGFTDIYCCTLDSLFNVVSSVRLPRVINNIALIPDGVSVNIIDEDNVLLAGEGHGIGNLKKYAMILRLNRNWDIVSKRFIERSLSGLLANEHSIAANPDEIYHVRVESNEKQKARGKVIVSKLNSALETEWERFAVPASSGEMDEWVLESFNITDDGNIVTSGCLLENGYSPMSAFLSIIHDETADVEENGLVVRPYLIYPNPVKDRLSIHISPDVKLESIELYDVSGRCVVSSRTAEMNVANLPAGQYVAKITLEDGKVYSDKVVKE